MIRSFLLGCLLLLAGNSIGQSWQDKIDDRLWMHLRDGGEMECIVLLQDQLEVTTTARKFLTKEDKGWHVFHSLKEHAAKTQAPLLEDLRRARAYHRSFFIVNAIHVKGPAELIPDLARSPLTRKIVANSPLQMLEPEEVIEQPGRGPSQIEWGIDMINADEVWNLGFRGQGVVVGGQDTGYDWEHPALKNKYRGWDGNAASHDYHWHDAIHEISPLHNDSIISPTNNPCGLDVPFPCDDNNHGTHTMGTMVGEEGDNQIGVAPEARWIACRNMERGYGQPSTYIECFEWFLAPTDLNDENPDPAKAPHVIANSWSCPAFEGCNPDNFALMETAVNNLKASGVVVVVSAGNSGSSGCGSVNTPAAIFENSFSVGATAQNDTITNFSSRGPVVVDESNRLKPNVSAPGRNVRSSIRNGQYASFSGTSMAGPHVAGAVALILSANPQLAGQVELIEDILEQTAVPKQTDQDCGDLSGMEVPNNTYGYGRIDALAAVQAALDLVSSTDNVGKEQTLTTYPNPFHSELTVDFGALEGQVSFSLVDVNGRVVLQDDRVVHPHTTQTWQLQKLPAGLYFYRVQAADTFAQGKVLKK